MDGFAALSVKLTHSEYLLATQKVQWTREMDKAFGRLRESLCSCVVLYVPVSSDSFVLYTDASGGGV